MNNIPIIGLEYQLNLCQNVLHIKIMEYEKGYLDSKEFIHQTINLLILIANGAHSIEKYLSAMTIQISTNELRKNIFELLDFIEHANKEWTIS